jgi:hypothetical protein
MGMGLVSCRWQRTVRPMVDVASLAAPLSKKRKGRANTDQNSRMSE